MKVKNQDDFHKITGKIKVFVLNLVIFFMF